MALLSTVSVGRVGICIDALPAVLPVNFAVHDGAVVFRTVPGTKLHDATQDAVVAFQADHYSDTRAPFGWSVLVRGVARQIIDPSTLAAARLLPLGSWALDGRPDPYVRVEPAMVSGRRVAL
jgi:nitroimidazol reductase NimA-like FMN-containing flavoprotein (pyridoxamine 5'-phosphate oxidase superfamily)